MNHLERITLKIFHDFEAFQPTLDGWKKSGDKIVFTNGCFDLLHQGHVDYLAKSADLGCRMIVGLNTDASVRLLKGPERPLVNEKSRAILLAALSMVDAIILFSEETPYDLIGKILPDVLVKGDDYRIEEIAGFDIVLENGGRVETIGLLPGFSTSALIEKLKNLGNEQS
jgi:rfaE bifunctional protein nucleotidyltransferase chain/domain